MRIAVKFIIVLLFFAILGIIIIYARGYRPDFANKTISSTGILALTSTPKAAKIYINDELKGVTDTNITLPPGHYKVEIKKEGYTPWSKQIILKGELVISLDALLFPINPSLSPLTNLGIIKAVPIDQTGNIILFVQNNDEIKDGIYLFQTSQKPLSFLPPIQQLLLKKTLPEEIDFTKDIRIHFSPDYKQALLEFENKYSYLIATDQANQDLFIVEDKSKENLLLKWQEQKEKNDLKILETFTKDFAKIASDSFQIIAFSPDETKILYQAKKNLQLPLFINPPIIASNQTQEQRSLIKNNYYIYDKKEDKNFPLNATFSKAIEHILWYPDSKHLVINLNKKISIVDYDGENNRVVYSGPSEETFYTTTSDGKIITLANFNPEANELPDLYLIGIK
jgi:hypothetical protein